MYGKLRVSDFLPAGEEDPDDVLERGYDSLSSAESDGCGLEHAYEGGDELYEDHPEAGPICDNLLVDFN